MTARFAILGPPASGKGTQASRLAQRVGVPHLSTGDLLRAATAAGTPLGERAAPYMQRGELVPDELVVEILEDELGEATGFVLDGFPRTEHQYSSLEVPLDRVIVLEIPEQESLRRVTGRRVCPEGHVYHVDYDPPEEAGVCDLDGKPLHRREDDREEVVRRRWREYESQTLPLIDTLESREGEVERVDGSGSPDEVAEHVAAATG